MVVVVALASNVQDLFGTISNGVKKLTRGSETGDDSDTIKDLDERFEKAKDARRPYEGPWLVNTSFYFGKQWVIYSSALQQLERPSVEPWRVMPNINFIRPSVLTAYSKITQTRQVPRTTAAGNTPEEEADARACDKLLEFLDPVSNAEEARNKAVVWMLITGTGMLKDCWDKKHGPIVGQDPETGEQVYLGEVQTHSVSPFEFYPEPGCNEIKDMDWCFHVTIRPASYIKKMYGVDMEDEEFESAMTYESQLRSIISDGTAKVKGVVLKEYYERPNDENPEGRFVVYGNDQVFEEGANPYPQKPIPFNEIRGNPRPDSFWGISLVDDMIDPQRIYNKTKGEALEIQRLMSKPKWMVPNGSLPESKEITNAPGEDIRYDVVSGKGPETVRGVDIPMGFFKVLEETRQELYDASGQHEVSRGQSPFTKTATGIAYLQEQDDARLSPMIRNFDRAYERSAETKLILCRQFYSEERQLTILGPNSTVELVAFNKNAIPENPKVHIQAGGQALPRSRVARQDFLLKLWTTKGASGQPLIDDPKLMMKLFEFGDIEGLYEDINADISQAERENATLLGAEGMPGQPVGVRKFHNHAAHIKEHNKVRNSVQYEQLDPNGQLLYDQHVEMHEMEYAQQIMNMQANMAGGAQPPKPRPSGGEAEPAGAPQGIGDLFESGEEDPGVT